MSRVIQTESAGKDRTRLVRTIVAALRELMHKAEPDQASRDLAAYIGLALAEIEKTIDPSVLAWEKKGFWVKADRFRLEWDWTGPAARKMTRAVLEESWGDVATVGVMISGKFAAVNVPEKHRLGTPWIGAYRLLKQEASQIR